MAWVLGEYGYTLGGDELPGIADKLCGLAERQHTDPDTKTYIVSALIKLVAQMVRPPSPARNVVRFANLRISTTSSLQNRTEYHARYWHQSDIISFHGPRCPGILSASRRKPYREVQCFEKHRLAAAVGVPFCPVLAR